MSINFASQEQQTPGFMKNTGAVIVGSTAGGLVAAGATLPTANLVMTAMGKVNKTITKDELQLLNKAGNEILKTSGLADKGVQIAHKFKIKNMLSLFKALLPKKLQKLILMHPYYQIAKGKNAAFSPFENKIFCTNKMALSQFHELGHAANAHKIGGFMGKIGNFFQNIRLDVIKQKRLANFGGLAGKIGKTPLPGKILALAAPIITLTALFKHKKAEGEKPVGFFDKVTTFIKNNVGKLTFATMLPMVMEEGIASLQGQKFAKTLLSPQLLKKVKICNALGFSTYLASAVIAGLTARLAVNIKDKIAQKNV